MEVGGRQNKHRDCILRLSNYRVSWIAQESPAEQKVKTRAVLSAECWGVV